MILSATIIQQKQSQGNEYFLHCVTTFSHNGFLADSFEPLGNQSTDQPVVKLKVRPTPQGIGWYTACTPVVHSVPLPKTWMEPLPACTKIIIRIIHAESGATLAETSLPTATGVSTQLPPDENSRPWPQLNQYAQQP